MNLYGIDFENRRAALMFFPYRDSAMAWAEKEYNPNLDLTWPQISRKLKLKDREGRFAKGKMVNGKNAMQHRSAAAGLNRKSTPSRKDLAKRQACRRRLDLNQPTKKRS
jgi:hypothetical protein